MKDEAEVATGIIKYWESITGAIIGLLAIFGIVLGKKKGVSPVTNKDLEILEMKIETRITQCASDIKKTVTESASDIYDYVDKRHDHTNDRIDKMMSRD